MCEDLTDLHKFGAALKPVISAKTRFFECQIEQLLPTSHCERAREHSRLLNKNIKHSYRAEPPISESAVSVLVKLLFTSFVTFLSAANG